MKSCKSGSSCIRSYSVGSASAGLMPSSPSIVMLGRFQRSDSVWEDRAGLCRGQGDASLWRRGALREEEASGGKYSLVPLTGASRWHCLPSPMSTTATMKQPKDFLILTVMGDISLWGCLKYSFAKLLRKCGVPVRASAGCAD